VTWTEPRGSAAGAGGRDPPFAGGVSRVPETAVRNATGAGTSPVAQFRSMVEQVPTILTGPMVGPQWFWLRPIIAAAAGTVDRKSGA
jgi:hypothetical protein